MAEATCEPHLLAPPRWASSYPLWFLWQPHFIHHSQVGIPPNERGTGGRNRRRIGTPH